MVATNNPKARIYLTHSCSNPTRAFSLDNRNPSLNMASGCRGKPAAASHTEQNRMSSIRSFAEFNSQLLEFIHRCQENEERFTELAFALFALQFHSVLQYRRLCEARGATPDKI